MSLNKAMIIGHLGADPKVTYLKESIAVATLSIATTEKGYTAKNGTVIPDRTEWHNVVLWRGLAEIADKYLRKGAKVYIEGKLRTRSYEDVQGATRYVTEIVADNMEMLSSQPQQPAQPQPQPVPAQQPAAQAAAVQQGTKQQPAQPTPPFAAQGSFSYKDELPF